MKFKITLLLVVLLTVICADTAYVDSYDGAGDLIIDTTWTSGDLQTRVEALLNPSGDLASDILSLYIIIGDIDSVDANYIDNDMTSLAVLNVQAPATFAATGNGCFYNNSVIQVIDIPSTIGAVE